MHKLHILMSRIVIKQYIHLRDRSRIVIVPDTDIIIGDLILMAIYYDQIQQILLSENDIEGYYY